jgi:lysozyme family protein
MNPKTPPNKGSLQWYALAWKNFALHQEYMDQIIAAADRVAKNKKRYEFVGAALGGVPWALIGSIHHMEGACDFSRVLHNGEKIVGKDVKTKLVPKDRGPFGTWEEAACDALKLVGMHYVKEWSIARCLEIAERYNGIGYLKYHKEENTPYLWSQTSYNDGFGKYVSDGSYNELAPANGQTGLAAIMKMLESKREFSLPVI